MGPSEYVPDRLIFTRVNAGSGTGCDTSGPAVHAGSQPSPTHPDPSSAGGANSARTPHPLDNPVALRAQDTLLADLIVEQQDALSAVRRYVEECNARTGALVDTATVAARLWPIVSGIDSSCPACAARRLADKRQAEFLVWLAGLARVEVGE